MSYIKRIVDDIFDDYFNGMTIEELAKKYDESIETIQVLISGLEDD